MFEKVSPAHPDKMCDRLAGAIVDLAYSKEHDPRIAVEVLAGHGKVFVIIETSLSREQLSCAEIDPIVWRIFGQNVEGNITIVPQDAHLSANQEHGLKVADNGIFKGSAPTYEQKALTAIAASIYDRHPFDGKYIIQGSGRLAAPVFDVTVCPDCTAFRKHTMLIETSPLLRSFPLMPPPLTPSPMSEPSLRFVAPQSTSGPPVHSPSGLMIMLPFTR